MEVVIQGVPERTTQKQLRDYFRPVCDHLSIDDWDCQKKKNKPFASLTFLSREDGQKFCSRHGSSRNGLHGSPIPSRTPLFFKGLPLFCSPGCKKPDIHMLKSLEMEAKTRQKKRHLEQNMSTTVSSIRDVPLKLRSILCGLWEYQGSNLVFMAHSNWIGKTVKVGARKITVHVGPGHRIDIPFSTIQAIVLENSLQYAITLTLTEAPYSFRNIDIGSTTPLSDTASLIQPMRQLNLRSGPSRARVPGLDSAHEAIAGSCLVYRLVLETTDEHVDLLSNVRGIPPIVRHHVQVHAPDRLHASQICELVEVLEDSYVQIPFVVKYQLQRLAQNSFLPPRVVLALLPEVANLLSDGKIPCWVSAIRLLFQQLPFPGVETESGDFQVDTLISLLIKNAAQSDNRDHYEDDSRRSEQMARIHRVTVTPAGIYLYGPDWESKNRVLRKYPANHDYFLRVQFCEEDGSQVRFNPDVSNKIIFHDRFKKILNHGIRIGGRRFSFLGFSHSSLRQQSCWFMAPFLYNGLTLSDRMLIRNLGDFSHIRCTAKCAARIGQAFSETPTAIRLAPGVAQRMNDVERNGRVFSDGVGTVSMSVLRRIWAGLPSTRKFKPTVFQIRYSGAKGMIALDSRLRGEAMFLRPSMIKFGGSSSTDIEICGGAYKPLPFFLNQQSIKILEDMGVKDEFFFHHQKKEIDRLRRVNSSSKHASEFLKSQGIGDRIQLPWFVQKLKTMNLSFQQDSFLRDVLEIAILVELRALKYKARIPVKDGYTLFGIMDETRILNEGQIFCIVEDDDGVRVITGDNILITRSPALHPGDIQRVNAVSVPSDSPLMQLRNCICFSQKGARDLPSQLGGGDLDGDLYQILFDRRATPKETFPAAQYPKQNPIDLGRPVNREDMTDFFIEFMETDQLGRISNQHKIFADQKKLGTRDRDCLTLAEMASTAVDFSKSGIPVDMTKLPRSNRYRPDFMAPGPYCVVEKGQPLSFDAFPENDNRDDEDEDDTPRYRYYESDKILGKLYRAIDEQEILSDIRQREVVYANGTGTPESRRTTVLHTIWAHVQDQCRLFQWMHHLEVARGIRDEYEECIQNIAYEYSNQPSPPLTEREVFIGNILGRTGAQAKKQHEWSVKMKERFNDELNYIVNRIVKDGPNKAQESLERSMACLQVALEKDLGGSKRRENLVSFGYVAAAICLKEMERMFG
ncbi:uncharacterized protein Z518_00690 [Rhinocladiella mackenziei CBS 650.93]|uniref:RNA-dependent RNA polymerase n=1 Tax=Rhinocladiella mackenziei CBS 650.93 TaxID=1442369 RepID=A0A0D2JJK1_9EURO|nr:uncharacterized protein Z518_00690 [Rhinocladiella mackenziei CBS 650.93]KIX09610.1 hypothetical protein Z518_00690 [Rhinocladiella mackenziei CBS 650.93]